MKKFITGLLVWVGVYAFCFILIELPERESIFALIFTILLSAFIVWDIYETYIKKYLKK